MPATGQQQKTSTPTFNTRIDLPAEKRTELIEMLNQSLAACFDLFSQTKQAHWNVKGRDFFQLHELFDLIAGELLGYVDKLAERATTLGGYATGTVRMAASSSFLPEYEITTNNGLEHVAALANRFAAFGEHVREAIDRSDDLGDIATSDLYIEITRTIDLRLWFLEAHIQDQENE